MMHLKILILIDSSTNLNQVHPFLWIAAFLVFSFITCGTHLFHLVFLCRACTRTRRAPTWPLCRETLKQITSGAISGQRAELFWFFMILNLRISLSHLGKEDLVELTHVSATNENQHLFATQKKKVDPFRDHFKFWNHCLLRETCERKIGSLFSELQTLICKLWRLRVSGSVTKKFRKIILVKARLVRSAICRSRSRMTDGISWSFRWKIKSMFSRRFFVFWTKSGFQYDFHSTTA